MCNQDNSLGEFQSAQERAALLLALPHGLHQGLITGFNSFLFGGGRDTFSCSKLRADSYGSLRYSPFW